MSVASDIVTEILSVDSSSSVSESDITNTMKNEAWENACEAVQNETTTITEKVSTSTWTSTEESDYGLDHFNAGIRAAIKAGRAVIAYKSNRIGYKKYVIYTKNKVYKFPTTNVNYFNAAVNSVKYYGAGSYFGSLQQTSNQTTANNTGSNYVQNYNYTQ